MESAKTKSISPSDSFNILQHLCEKRKSCRQFSQQLVTEEQLAKIELIARTSPYASARKSWDILFIKDKQEIAEISRVIKEQVKEISGSLPKDFKDSFLSYAKHFTAFETAPVLIIPTFRVAPSLSVLINMEGSELMQLSKIKEWERDNYTKSISCVCMLILLAAESLGLGSCYMTGPLLTASAITERIKIKPGQEIGALLPIGYCFEK